MQRRKIRAAMVTDIGGIGDESFNASAWRGLQRAQRELGADVRYLESRSAADYVRNLTSLARQGYEVVFAIGFLMEDALARVAPRFRRSISASWTVVRRTSPTASRSF
jgi:basic membrane protein A